MICNQTRIHGSLVAHDVVILRQKYDHVYYFKLWAFAKGCILQEGEVLTFPLLLFPQRSGILLLPSVKIWPLPADSTEQPPTQRRSEPRPLVCETDNTTETKTILVIPNLGSTTMGLDTGDTESAAWLVDSKPRNGLLNLDGGSGR